MLIENINFLQPSGFRIVIDRINYPNLQYFVQGVDHPSVTVPVADTGYSRITSVAQTGDKIEYSEVVFDIMIDENMNAYTEMHDWLKFLVETNYVPKTKTGFGKPSHIGDITLLILNSAQVPQRKIVYKNAFPVSLGNVRFESTSSDATVITVSVTFHFTYFEVI